MTKVFPPAPIPLFQRSETRMHARKHYHALCRIGMRNARMLGILIDASVAGVQCEIVSGPLPCVDECVLLEWPDTTLSFAEIMWIKNRRIGLRLSYMAADFADRIDIASLGAESYSRLRLLQAEPNGGVTD
ncbi:MAG TPA: hypothetical protein PKD49_13685 [Hyphomicrobium sp.]|nr:hypothetical protein [Hyphomicrobium sp.]